MAAFESRYAELSSAGISVVAASTDSPKRADEMKRELVLSFPLFGGLSLENTAQLLGSFYEERRGILHATGFLLDPDGRIAVSSYSSGAIGRLWPDETMSLVRTFRARRSADQ